MAPDISSGLDTEISDLESHIQFLETRRALLSSTLLSSPNTLTRLQNVKSTTPTLTTALDLATKQATHNLTSTHRLCAGATAFLVQDPDPAAVDNGRVLGVRIDVFTAGAFDQPYYLFFHQAEASPEGATGETPVAAGDSPLRLHKHTIPPFIPLTNLARRYLDTSLPARDVGEARNSGAKRQDLGAFVRALRHELMCYHKRHDAIHLENRQAGAYYSTRLKERLGLGSRRDGRDHTRTKVLKCEARRRIWAADKAAKVVEMWLEDVHRIDDYDDDVFSDEDEDRLDGGNGAGTRVDGEPGLTGRMELGVDGQVERVLVRRVNRDGRFGERAYAIESAIQSGDGRIVGFWERIKGELGR